MVSNVEPRPAEPGAGGSAGLLVRFLFPPPNPFVL